MIVIDETEALGASLVALREVLLDSLPHDTRIVLAGRATPDRSWLTDGLEHVAIDMPLAPLPEHEARQLLAQYHVFDDARARSALDWASGSPLALTIAATSDQWQDDGDIAAQLGDRLVHFLAGNEIGGIDPAVLEVAAVTSAVDARLLAAALPGHGTRGAMRDLQNLSIVEVSGHRARLHPLVADAIAERLRRLRPEDARTLVLRIADHLRSRAAGGDQQALFELTDLVEDEFIRTGAGLSASATHYADALRDGDLELAESALGIAEREWWPAVRDLILQHRMFTTAVRRVDGTLVGVGAFVPSTLMAGNDVVGPVLEHVATNGDPRRTLIGLATLMWEHDEAAAAELLRVGNASALARAGIPNLRTIAAIDWMRNEGAFTEAMGYVPVAELRRSYGGVEVDVLVADFGEGGLVGRMHELVSAEQGRAPEPASAPGMLDALRSARADPVAAEIVRSALEARFDDTAQDRKLRTVLELSFLGEPLGERAILDRLHLSRATYYRHLRAARERLLA